MVGGLRNYCAAHGCTNTRKKYQKMLFAPFPMREKDVERCRQWIKNMKKSDVYCPADHDNLSPEEKANSISTRNLFLCEAHFTDNQFLTPMDKGYKESQKQLIESAVPTIFPRPPPRIRPPIPTFPPFTPRKPLLILTPEEVQKLQTSVDSTPPNGSTSRVPPILLREKLHLVDHPYSCPFMKVPSNNVENGTSANSCDGSTPMDTPCEKALKQRIKVLSVELKRMSSLYRKERRKAGNLEKKVTKLQRFAPSSSLKKNLVEASAKFMTTAGLEMYKHQISNHGKAACGRRYTTELKDIAISLYKESPSAYKMWSEIFVLPVFNRKHPGGTRADSDSSTALANLQETLDEVVSKMTERDQNLQDTLDDVVSRMSETEQESSVIEMDEMPETTRFDNMFLIDGVLYAIDEDDAHCNGAIIDRDSLVRYELYENGQ